MLEKTNFNDVFQLLKSKCTNEIYLPTQNKLSFPILHRLYLKMKIGVQFQPIQVKENFIVNGHHRYIASKLADIEMECIPWEAPEIMMTYQWKEIWLDPLDWDTPEEIKAYHQKDAQEYKFDKSILDFFETNIP